jgi:chitin synthase
MRAPSTRRKNTIKRMPTVNESGDVEEQDREEDENNPPTATLTGGASPCVAGEFKSALDTLFETIEETQSWYIFCINPNDSQLPNQLEGQSVKGQVKAVGMTEMARRCINVFEVGMTPEEFCDRYRDGLTTNGVTKGNEREMVGQARNVFGLGEKDLVLGQHKVWHVHINLFLILTFFDRYF